MADTHFTGPVLSGDLITGQTSGPNQGYVQLTQATTLTQNGTSAVSSTLYIPAGSTIQNFLIDVLTAHNSGTSDTLSAGITAGGTQYVSGVSMQTAGRISPTFTGAQLGAMSGQSIVGVAAATTAPVVITATPVGTTATAGYTNVTVVYTQLTSS